MQAQLSKNKTYELRLDSAKNALSIAKRELEVLRRASGMEYIWKISKWGEQYKAAGNGKKTVINSPPFYAFRNGYQFMISLCPYGDLTYFKPRHAAC